MRITFNITRLILRHKGNIFRLWQNLCRHKIIDTHIVKIEKPTKVQAYLV